MGLLTTTRWLWIPALAMLVSASATSKFMQGHDGAAEHNDEWRALQPSLHTTLPDSCCNDSLPAIDSGLLTSPDYELSGDTADDAASADLWSRMRNGFALPEVDSDAVLHHIRAYTKHPQLLSQILARGEPYLYHILDELERAGLPAELALLPVVESAYDPFATSPAGAAGLWQFMPETADYLGLDQDGWYDARRDVIDSTGAALAYLERLEKRFKGDWLLALAAYNAGGARVQRAINSNREAGKDTGYWSLGLPAETRAYVPKLIALQRIVNDPQAHGVTLPDMQTSRYFRSIEVNGQIELRVLARLSGLSVDALQRLNPGFGLAILPPGDTHRLLVPAELADSLQTRIAQLPAEQRVQSVRYRIQAGDNLSTLAQLYRTTVSDIRKLNRLEGNTIIEGRTLIIPVGTREDAIASLPSPTLM